MEAALNTTFSFNLSPLTTVAALFLGAGTVFTQDSVGEGNRRGADAGEARAKQHTALLHLALAAHARHVSSVGDRQVVAWASEGIAVCCRSFLRGLRGYDGIAATQQGEGEEGGWTASRPTHTVQVTPSQEGPIWGESRFVFYFPFSTLGPHHVELPDWNRGERIETGVMLR